jgi:predicted negative regulator of RcsB-dependent stress response
MGKVLVVVLGLGILGAIGWRVMSKTSAVTEGPEESSAPKQQLDNVRGAAKRIEANEQKAVDDVEKKAFGE